MKKVLNNKKALQLNSFDSSQLCYTGADWFVVPTFSYDYNKNLSIREVLKNQEKYIYNTNRLFLIFNIFNFQDEIL